MYDEKKSPPKKKASPARESGRAAGRKSYTELSDEDYDDADYSEEEEVKISVGCFFSLLKIMYRRIMQDRF